MTTKQWRAKPKKPDNQPGEVEKSTTIPVE